MLPSIIALAVRQNDDPTIAVTQYGLLRVKHTLCSLEVPLAFDTFPDPRTALVLSKHQDVGIDWCKS